MKPEEFNRLDSVVDICTN